MMKFRDFRIGWRLLIQEPAYSAVVVLGLSVGFAACFLLLGFVRHSFSYDAQVPDAQQIYLVKTRFNIIGDTKWFELAPLPYLEEAKRNPMVADATMLFPLGVPMKAGAQVQPIRLAAVNEGFGEMFGVRPLEGDLRSVLKDAGSVALTSSTAQRLFGRANVLGQTVSIEGDAFRVGAILPDPAPNSTIFYEALAGQGTTAWPDGYRKNILHAWGGIGGKVYVKLKPGASAAAVEQALQYAGDHSPLVAEAGPEAMAKLAGKKAIDIRLGALPSMYFDDDTANVPGSSDHGDLRVIGGLGAIALVILLLAATNYVNLATVRTVRRQREIAVRKVLGAPARRLAGQFIAESMLVALIATGFGLLLAWLLLPVFSELVDRQLKDMFSAANLLAALALGVVTGLLAGIYPAWVALGVRPQRTLAGRGSAETSGGLWLRRALTVAQFTTAICLTAVTLAIAWQARFASNANPGFDAAGMLVLELPQSMRGEPAQALRAQLSHLAGVKGVAIAQNAIGEPIIGNYVPYTTQPGAKASLLTRDISANFFEVVGVKAMAGRLFDSTRETDTTTDKVVIDAAAARSLGFSDPAMAVGQIITSNIANNSQPAQVIGIAPPLRIQSLHEAVRPVVWRIRPRGVVQLIRGDGDLGALQGAIETMLNRQAPDQVFGIERAQTYLAKNYADDLRLAKLLGLASVVAIAIAAFGIYVLATYSVQRMARQIVLRKLYGAGHAAIVTLVGREFARLLAIGAAIALPLAALVNARYLAGFVERAPMGVWPLLAALMVAALVAMLSTLRHTLGALRMAPAHVLRD
ncbi:ABC transporter permease [Massilia sp. R2A-15]|uniref:ABC transporter permease n=1 Tax=Massilia sp. R2A-15 TaxID=3064278 RepID=UPI0027372837|nr:ABC transporter permease [Massilia sp. R2A-15]WLI88978.1 ABC transporter permease [Massilia sp. R2A-15]